jgi:hypothetical protein
MAAATLPACVHAAGPAQPDASAGIDATTYHYDTFRTGWNPSETTLTPATVASTKFGLLHTFTVDSDVLAEPLLVSGFRMPDGVKHDVLLVVTEHNSVYAFDAVSYAQLWMVNLGTAQSTVDLGCTFLYPENGISATPVIVRGGVGQAAVYVVAATEPQAKEFHYAIHKLDLGTGKDLIAPVNINAQAAMSDGSTIRFSPFGQWIRAGLAWGNGSLYMGASTWCDTHANKNSGWLLRYDADLVQQAAFSTVYTPASFELAAIWMSGFAPAIDGDGSVFVVTGNGAWIKGEKDWGESVLRLPPSLTKVADWFTPADAKTLNGGDSDFGSGGVMLLPAEPGQLAPPMAVAMGKSPLMYLMDRGALGHKQAHDVGALQVVDLRGTGGGVWGGPAYYQGPQGGVVFYQIFNDVLRAFAVSTGSPPSLTATVRGGSKGGFGGSLPIVSSNGSQAGTGVVWLVNRAVPLLLEAYDAEKLGAPIFSATIPTWTAGTPILTPLEANGRVYVGTKGQVLVFGLSP